MLKLQQDGSPVFLSFYFSVMKDAGLVQAVSAIRCHLSAIAACAAASLAMGTRNGEQDT